MRGLFGAFVLAGVPVILGGCTSHEDCCGGCPGSGAAEFDVACGESDLTDIVLSGAACATPAVSMPGTGLASAYQNGRVFIEAQSAGTCHVELVFATGFTYEAEVTFATQPGGVCGGPQCSCADYLVPTAGPFTVGNPSSTCVAASDGSTGEASVAGGDGAAADGESSAGAGDAERAEGGDDTGTLGTSAESGAAEGGAAEGGPFICVPHTCADFPVGTCGQLADGCGGITADCSDCVPPQFCGGGGPNLCGGPGPMCVTSNCVPQTCASIDCGLAGDGCGGVLDCGACPFSESCMDNQCVWPADAGPCLAETCGDLGFHCGFASDGCGDHLDCGTCSGSQFCGGGGDHQCGGTCFTPDGGCDLTCIADDAGAPDAPSGG